MGRIVAQLLRAGRRHPAHAAARGARAASTSSAAEYGLRVANVFHAGDGNLHPLVCYDGAVPGEAERAEELAGRIVDGCVDAGGSITGEHGVGVDKKRYMPEMFGEADLDAFQRLRCAFDPDGLANPGKVMPTPRLCGEVPGPYRRHPLEAGRPGGALLMATARRSCAAAARGGARGSRAGRVGGGTKLGWGRPTPEPTPELSTAGLDRDRRAQRGRPHRGARGRRAAGRARRSAFAQRRPDARARPARPAAARRSAASWPPATPARCATATAARATSSSACTVALADGTVAKRGRQGDQERRRLRPRQALHRARSARSA